MATVKTDSVKKAEAAAKKEAAKAKKEAAAKKKTEAKAKKEAAKAAKAVAKKAKAAKKNKGPKATGSFGAILAGVAAVRKERALKYKKKANAKSRKETETDEGTD